MIRIFLADDHPIVRNGIRTILESESSFQIIGESGDGLQTVRLIEQLHPDVLVTDMMMPGLSGLEVIRQVSQMTPVTRTLLISMHGEESYVLEALRNGATGYILKNAPAPELLQAVRDVAAGKRFLSAALSERVIENLIKQSAEVSQDAYDLLTTREREVLMLTAEGLNNTEIAERLSLSPRTVETHRNSFMRKLGLHTQTDVIRYAIKRGLVPLDR